ncbi:MAG: transposase [bacterium]
MSDGSRDAVAYFITVRTFRCRSVFHEASRAATVADIIETLRRQAGFKKYGYVVMPDHYHILLGGGTSSRSVADIVLAINARIERFVEVPDDGQPMWDDEPEVMVLYTPRSRVEKLNYIHRKPVLCGVVDRPEDYEHSSARFYVQRHGRCVFDLSPP